MIFEKEILNTRPNWNNVKFTQETIFHLAKTNKLPVVVNEYSEDVIIVEKLYVEDKRLLAKVNIPDTIAGMFDKVDFRLVPKFSYMESKRYDGLSNVSKCEISYLLLVFPFRGMRD